ncbi:MAG TPA: MgtC/SapB family protein [Chloroflexi bacterium]|nr:MgtC/SapB family protein [Chloroflexota bacterium]
MTGWPEMVLRVLLALGLSAAIGYERERRQKPAGLRTHCLIGVGAATFTLASLYGFDQSEVARVAAGVVAGVGFIGGGVIFRGVRGEVGVAGLTTATAIWVTAAIGLAAACGLVLLAVTVAVISLIILELPKIQD